MRQTEKAQGRTGEFWKGSTRVERRGAGGKVHPPVAKGDRIHGKADGGIKASNITRRIGEHDGKALSREKKVENSKRKRHFIVCPANVSADNVVAARSRRCGRVWNAYRDPSSALVRARNVLRPAIWRAHQRRHQPDHQSPRICNQHSPGVGPPSPASKNMMRSRWNAGSFGARPTNKRAQRFRVKRAGCESYRV